MHRFHHLFGLLPPQGPFFSGSPGLQKYPAASSLLENVDFLFLSWPNSVGSVAPQHVGPQSALTTHFLKVIPCRSSVHDKQRQTEQPKPRGSQPAVDLESSPQADRWQLLLWLRLRPSHKLGGQLEPRTPSSDAKCSCRAWPGRGGQGSWNSE